MACWSRGYHAAQRLCAGPGRYLPDTPASPSSLGEICREKGQLEGDGP
jgi:hypothetical protein